MHLTLWPSFWVRDDDSVVADSWRREGANSRPASQFQSHGRSTECSIAWWLSRLRLEKLADEDPVKAQLVKLRFFVGLSLPEACRALGMSETTGKRHWAYARAWLYDALTHRG